MRFHPPLIPATLQRRYKRFLADVTLATGETITCVCPNTGAMTGLATEGNRVWLSTHDTATRKYRHGWELVEVDGRGLIGIHSAFANALVAEALQDGAVKALADYTISRREAKLGDSRIDFLLSKPGAADCYVEVKSVTFMRNQELAEFPDTRTERGMKHLGELAKAKASGHRAIMLYIVQCAAPKGFSIARDVDPAYAQAFDAATMAGVEAIALTCHISPDECRIDRQIPILDLK